MSTLQPRVARYIIVRGVRSRVRCSGRLDSALPNLSPVGFIGPRLGVGIIIPSAELLAQLTARLNGFKYSALRAVGRLLSPARGPLGRSMEREICGRRPLFAVVRR